MARIHRPERQGFQRYIVSNPSSVGVNQTIVKNGYDRPAFLQWKSTDDIVTEEEQETAQDFTNGNPIYFIL